MSWRRNLTAEVVTILNHDQTRRVGLIPKVALISAAIVTVMTVSVLQAVPGQQPIQSGPDASQPIVPVVAGAKPAFDVTSVRPRNTDGPSYLDTPSPNRALAINYAVQSLILSAYRIQPYQLLNLPGWAETERFDVVGVSEHPFIPTDGLLMFRALLADRFNLRMHTETRQLPIYALVPARKDGSLGPQLRRTVFSRECIEWQEKRRAAGANGLDRVLPPEDCKGRPFVARAGYLSAGQMPMASLVRQNLSRILGQPVVNETGLEGVFDLDLSYTPPNATPSEFSDAPTIFTALDEQLGLKLVARRAPVVVLVVDHIDRPTPN
jgi:uncharacterized protein (TIGR03435 family)